MGPVYTFDDVAWHDCQYCSVYIALDARDMPCTTLNCAELENAFMTIIVATDCCRVLQLRTASEKS